MTQSMKMQKAVQSFLNGKDGLGDSSYANNKHRLKVFREWTRDEKGITHTDQITPLAVHEFKLHRQDQIALVTLKNQLGTVREFLQWGERMNLVQENVGTHMKIPKIRDGEDVNEKSISANEAEQILDYLRKYEYGTFDHVAFLLMWHTGCRIGTLESMDKRDFNYHEEYITVRHRPNQGTTLKNKEAGQRQIALTEDVTRVVQDWLDQNHPGVPDQYDRMPLMGTNNGRAHTTTIRNHIYKLTRPCVYANSCPEGLQPKNCDAAGSQQPSTCPVNYNPHAIRKGAITHLRNVGCKREDVSGRANVSEEVLEKHYDMASEAEKRERRKGMLDNL